LLILLNAAVLSEEVTHTYFIVFGLTRSELEPTTYRTRGKHANHYIADAFQSQKEKGQNYHMRR
jgi:hypothetical protein